MTKHKRKMSEDEAIYCLKAESERYPQVCEECPLYGQTGCDHCYDDANDVAIKALRQVQQYRASGTMGGPNNGWIPCSDKLPQEHNKYLVTCEGIDIPQIRSYDGKWDSMARVIAWQPLPECYKEEL